MSLKALIMGQSNVSPSAFSINLVARLATAGLTGGYDNEGPFLASLSWETTRADTTGAGGGFDLRMDWRSPALVTRTLGQVTRALNDITVLEAYSIYMIRSAPGALWEINAGVINPGDSLISWRFAAVPLISPDVLSF